MQDWVAGWTRRHGLPGPVADRLAEIGIGRYAARIYPDATAADLRVVAALFTWFFLADDECDRSLPAPGRVHKMVTDVLDTLETGAQVLDGPLGAMLADAWQVPYRRMPAHWRARFVGAVEHHLRGVVVEARNKATGHRPGVAEYVELRRATSAAYVAHALVDFAAGVPVPEAVWRHPAVRAYSAAGNDLLSWFNDLLSLDQDAATSGGHNLVLAVATELSLPVAEATDRVREHWQHRMRALPGLRAALPALGPAAERYLDGVDHTLRATVDWCLESPRYR
ncbi:terpene synthase [Actinomycetes bacterium KLBMP 9797]